MKNLFVLLTVSLLLLGGNGTSIEKGVAEQPHKCWCPEHIF